MKKANRILALVMALVLVLGLATTVSAAGTSSITITATTNNHHYEAYQIFKGDLNGAGTQQDPYVLSNIVWGNGISEEGKAAFGDAADKAASIKTAEDAKAFALAVKGYLTAPSEFTQNGTTYTLTGLDAGYYLVKDKDATQDIENGSYTAFIMKVAGAVTATAKDDVPTVTKYVKDENDSDYSETNNWQDSADYEIGDAVPFKVEATLADNVSAFEGPYKLVFDDTMV